MANSTENPPEPPARDPARLVALRRLQIRSVALGTVGSLLLLTGFALRAHVLIWIGFSCFTFALLAIVVLGAIAWWTFG